MASGNYSNPINCMSNRINQILAFLVDTPNDPFLNYALAQEWWKAGDKENALIKYQWLVAEHPNYVATYYHLGKCLIDLGQKEAAMEVFDKGIGIARSLKEQHALSELQSAKLALEYDED